MRAVQWVEFAFQLSGEARPTTRSVEGLLARALRGCGIRAPPGFAYQGHSISSLGASAMAAIDRSLYRLEFLRFI